MSQIGDLVATLVADTKQWQTGLATAKSELSAFAGSVATAFVGIAASFKVVDFAKTAIFAAEDDIRAAKKLEGVFSATGHSAGVTKEQVSKLATELQRMNGIEDDATMGAAAVLATFKNIQGDNLLQAIRLSHDLATVWDMDVLSAAKRLGKELHDLPVDEVNAKLAELQGRFGGTAAEAATATQKIKVAFGDVVEQMGGELLPAVELISTRGLPIFYSVNDTLKETGDEAVTASDHVMNYVRALIVPINVPAQWALLRDIIKDINGEEAPKFKFDMPDVGKGAGAAAANLMKETPFAQGESALFGDMEDQFHDRIRRMKNDAAELRGEMTNAEKAFKDAIAEGFDIEQAKAIEEQVRLLDGLKELDQQAKETQQKIEEIQRSVMTPGEVLDQKIKELEALRDAGKISEETFNRASKKAQEELKGKDTRDNKFAALQKGSSEALSAIFNAGKTGDKAGDAALENVEQNDVIIGLLRDIKDEPGVKLVVGSLA